MKERVKERVMKEGNGGEREMKEKEGYDIYVIFQMLRRHEDRV